MIISRRIVVGGLAGATAGLLRPAASAVSNSRAPAVPPRPDGGDTILLRIAGDDVSAATVIPQIAQTFLNQRGASDVRITPAAAPWTLKVSGTQLTGGTLTILIAALSTEIGYRMFVEREVDIWVAGAAATRQQMVRLAKLGTVDETPIARYAIIVAVPPSNPVQAMSYEQLRDVYAGRITDWQQLGGRPGQINLYARIAGSAAAATFEANILGPTPMAPSARVFPVFSKLSEALRNDPNGIGYLTFSFATGLKPLNLTERGRVSSRPTPYGLETGDYPLGNTVVLYRITNTTDDVAASFFRETRSARSRYLLAVQGYASVEPLLLVPEIDPPIPREYGVITDNGLRVSTTIRFDPGSTALGPTDERQLDALAIYLRALSVTPAELAHIGFSEDTGDPAKNLAISQQLGAVVTDALRQRAVLPGAVYPFGAALLLESDAVPDGQRRNRRVETWIRP